MSARHPVMTKDAIRKRLKRAGIEAPMSDAFIKINNHHHEHPDLGLWLTAQEVRELAGCADPDCPTVDGAP